MSESILDRPPLPRVARLHYGEQPSQFGDLRMPDGSAPYPCAIVIHGGYWRARYDLEYMGHICEALRRAGIATWNVEFRRVGEPDGGWPGTFVDIAAAARFLNERVGEFGIDSTRLFSLGHSAGGHLALWLASLHQIDPASAIASVPVPLQFAVSLAGVVDLDEAWRRGLSKHAAGELLGGSPGEWPDRFAAASPAALLPLAVPQLLVHGTADDAVPFVLSEEYVRSARAVGDRAELMALEGSGHFEPVDPETPEWASIQSRIVEMLRDGT